MRGEVGCCAGMPMPGAGTASGGHSGAWEES